MESINMSTAKRFPQRFTGRLSGIPTMTCALKAGMVDGRENHSPKAVNQGVFQSTAMLAFL
jgi:hypothetical protein